MKAKFSDDAVRFGSLASASRVAVMSWLKEPRRHFPRQVHADIDEVGVCCTFITEKLGIAPATTTRHMRVLADAGLVRAKRIGKFTYYRRVDAELKRLVGDLANL